MKLPSLQLGDLVAKVPIIQGGMGIGISRSSLASAVANEGGIGIISGVQIGFNEPDFETNNNQANTRALVKEIRKAKALSPGGIIGVNFLVAMNNYKEMVKTAIEEKIDVIISGAGLPKELPALVKDSKTKIAPVVSSGKAASVIAKLWDRKYNYIPDMVIVEGCDAGGHLGFSKKDLSQEKKPCLKDAVVEVIESLKPYAQKYNKKIPVIAAGGIFTGKDISDFIKIGASGVQIGSRFVATHECDAHDNFKNAYINSTKDTIRLVQSPVGMPGRAIDNKFTKLLDTQNIPIKKCYNCLTPCDPSNSPYCISKALINAVNGDIDNGLIFAGSNAYKIKSIVSVKNLIHELMHDATCSLQQD